MDAARWAGERRPLGLRRRTAKNRLIQRLETAPPLLNTRPPIQPATPQAVNARKTPLLTSTYGIAAHFDDRLTVWRRIGSLYGLSLDAVEGSVSIYRDASFHPTPKRRWRRRKRAGFAGRDCMAPASPACPHSPQESFCAQCLC